MRMAHGTFFCMLLSYAAPPTVEDMVTARGAHDMLLRAWMIAFVCVWWRRRRGRGREGREEVVVVERGLCACVCGLYVPE